MIHIERDDTQTTLRCKLQQDKKQLYSRHKVAGLVILVQGFRTQKVVAYRLALWEFK